MIGDVARYLGKVGEFIRFSPIGMYALAPQTNQATLPTDTIDSNIKTKQISIENENRFWRGPARIRISLLQVIVVFDDDLKRVSMMNFTQVWEGTIFHTLIRKPLLTD